MRENMIQIRPMTELTPITVPVETVSLYINFTSVLDQLTDASHDNPELIRNAIASPAAKIMTILLYSEDGFIGKYFTEV